MRQKLASYNAVTAAPWTEASKKFMEAMSAATDNGSSSPRNGAKHLRNGVKSPTRK